MSTGHQQITYASKNGMELAQHVYKTRAEKNKHFLSIIFGDCLNESKSSPNLYVLNVLACKLHKFSTISR